MHIMEKQTLKKSYLDSHRRVVDQFFSIIDMSVSSEANFNVVIGNLKGSHGRFVNNTSDKGYFILNGSGEVYLGNEIISVSPNDFVFIPKNTPHGIKGEIEFLIITSPIFNPQNESNGDKVE